MSNIAQATANAPAHAPVHTPAPLPQQATNAPAAQAVIPPVAPAVSVPNQPPPPIPVPARSGRLDIVKDWWWEALTWLVGTISTWLLMALLCHFDKKPVSQWKSKISLNAIVAILSQAAQSALCVSVGSCISQLKWRWIKTDQPVTDIALFDRASRGPEGSLVLLMKMIFKYHSMSPVYLGALTTILILSFGTFAQQAVSSNFLFLQPVIGEGQIARATAFPEFWVTDLMQTGLWNMTDRNGTNLRVGPRETAIITGMHGGNVSWSDVPGTCSTGYCTWPPYKSLGFCSSVDDVTSSIRKNCTSDHCTYSVLPLNSTSPQAPPGLTYPKFYRANSSLNDQTANFWVGSVYENFGLLDIYIIWEHVPFPSGQYSATRGRIEPCVHNLTSRMDNGTVTTALISSENDWKPFKVPPPANSPYFGPYCVKIEDPTSSYSLFNESGIGICYSDEQDGLHPFLRYLATDIFDGTAQSLGHNQPENNFFDNNWVFYTFMSIYGRHILYDMGPTPGFDGFSELLQNLTESISNAIRIENGGYIAAKWVGSMYNNTPHFSTDWRWLLAPIILWTLTTILFAATLFFTLDHRPYSFSWV